MSDLSFLQDINALGTLILAIIAVIAILVPIGITRYQRPKFSVRLQAIKYDAEFNVNPEIRILVTNVGKYPGHSCKVLATIEEDNGKGLDSYYLPWEYGDPDEYKPKGSDQEDVTKYTSYEEVRYVPIDIFPHESIPAKFLFLLDVYYAVPETSIWAVFGASGSYYYFPRWNHSEPVTAPPLSEYSPPLAIPWESSQSYLERNITYCVKITLFSEERTYLDLKKLFFKLGDKGISAGYTKECADVRTWKDVEINPV